MKAIITAISDNYTFTLANLLMSLKDNSPGFLDEVCLEIYSNDISMQNINLLKKLHSNINIRDLDASCSCYPPIKEYLLKTMDRWGGYIFSKIFAFELIHKYEQMIWFDSDMFVNANINNLWELRDFGFSWRPVIAWDPKKALSEFISTTNNTPISCPHGGLVVYDSNVLRNVDLSRPKICEICRKALNIKGGGPEERLLGLLAYENRIKVNTLDISYNCPVLSARIKDAKIIHFFGNKGLSKPWQDNKILYSFPEWAVNYKKFLKMKGDHNALAELTWFDHEKLLIQNIACPALLGIIHTFDAIKDPSLNFLIVEPYNCVRFFINGVSKNIYYECVAKIKNNSLEIQIYLRIENNGIFEIIDTDKLSAELVELTFGKPIPIKWKTWLSERKFELYIHTTSNCANVALNNLIKCTKNYIINNLGSMQCDYMTS